MGKTCRDMFFDVFYILFESEVRLSPENSRSRDIKVVVFCPLVMTQPLNQVRPCHPFTIIVRLRVEIPVFRRSLTRITTGQSNGPALNPPFLSRQIRP